jgi:CubicO group peptidase (beta-lactamase class C family)
MSLVLTLRRLLLQRVLPLGILLALFGCSGPIRQLHAVGNNEFSLFPNERAEPPPIDCSGSLEERYACFAEALKQQGQKVDVSGAFALSTPDGKIRFFGHTDELNAKTLQVNEDTPFPAASVTKMFIAAAAVSLSQDGSLDLQQPISRYLPELGGDVGVGAATLHQLLTHTSGLGSPPMCEKGEQDLPALLDKYGKQPLLAPPGAVFNYSNPGYSFVALVLERVAGQPFERIVAERVLSPAGIPGASFGPDQVAVRGQRSLTSEAPARCRAMWPAGGLVLSVRELAQWAGQMARPESSKLSRGVLEALMAPQRTMDDRVGAAYGYGVRRFEHGGLTIFNHPGGMGDFSSFVAWSPERGLAVAAFANRAVPLASVGFRALSTFLDIPADWRPPPGPAHPLSAYVGVYMDRGGTLGRLRVSLEENDLVIDYLDAAPALLPPNFSFVFEPGAERPRYVVTPVGVGERSAN